MNTREQDRIYQQQCADELHRITYPKTPYDFGLAADYNAPNSYQHGDGYGEE